MMLTIKNEDELDKFLRKHMDRDHTLYSEKGPAPAGATDSEGDPIAWDINVAWVCRDCGERMDVLYEEQSVQKQ